MASIFGINRQKGSSARRLTAWMLALGLILMLLPATTSACRLSTPANDGEGGLMFHVTGHSIQGNYLIITYDIEYPGMTKVKLYNGNNELLWRSQYVNDKQGEHRLVLKASALNPGNYVFEFDYKNQIQNYSISM
jgi:hypothetical protein